MNFFISSGYIPIKCERNSEAFGVSSPSKKTAIDFDGWEGIWQSMQFLSIPTIRSCVGVLKLSVVILWQPIQRCENNSLLPRSFLCVLWHVLHVIPVLNLKHLLA